MVQIGLFTSDISCARVRLKALAAEANPERILLLNLHLRELVWGASGNLCNSQTSELGLQLFQLQRQCPSTFQNELRLCTIW